MHTEDSNLDQIESINDHDDLEFFDEEADFPDADELDKVYDEAARGLYDEPIVREQDDVTKPNLHMVDADLGGETRAKAPINDLPISVTAQVGMFSMTLDELDKLNQGDLINVSPDYQNKVSLQVSGVEIGVGEIVSINGEVAIQITRLWS